MYKEKTDISISMTYELLLSKIKIVTKNYVYSGRYYTILKI